MEGSTLAGTFRVIVFDAEEGGMEPAYEAESQEDALRWAREWMREPMGLAVAIVPPSVN